MTPEQYQFYWNKATDYGAYRDLIVQLLHENKTTGPDQSEPMVKYTRKNLERMDRVTDIFTPISTLMQVMTKPTKALRWLVITEAWCGDAAQLNPAIAAAAALHKDIQCRFILRDEHPELMDAFLTKGGRSIPLIIFLDQSFDLVGRWGPRPQPLQQLIETWKTQEGMTFGQMVRNVHQWYDEDRTITFQKELSDYLSAME